MHKNSHHSSVGGDFSEMAEWTIKKGLARDRTEASFFLVAIFIVITLATFLLAEGQFRDPDIEKIRSLVEESKN